MDKKSKKKTVIKRKAEDPNESEKKKIMITRKVEEEKDKVEVVNQVVEVPVEQGQQIVHTGQIVEGNFEQSVFVNMKGEPVQIGPNTVILYEQTNGTPANFAFGGMWTMDSSGRIVMAETIYDVKGEPDEETATFVQNTNEVANQPVEEQSATFQQFELTTNSQVEGQEYEVAIIENPQDGTERSTDNQIITTEAQLVATGPGAVRWLNQKYDFVVRKLQLNYDAGVKLMYSDSGCIQCVYFTTPSMQQAFNAVPQFLCIETGIEFNSNISAVTGSTASSIKHNVTLFLAEDGNGKSVIVSAGISTLIGEDLRWLLETFKSCNPAWRQVRCVVCDPTKSQEEVRSEFPNAHVTCSVWQASCAAANLVAETARREDGTAVMLSTLTHEELATRCKAYALATLRGDHTPVQLQTLKRNIIGSGAGSMRLLDVVTKCSGAITKFDQWLEAENYTNILHKCTCTHTNTPRHSSAAICKYGTSTQECSCLFSKVFRLPCRHILMLTTELKVKTHIPFEPRWTVQYCLFGCDTGNASTGNSGTFLEQVVVDEGHRQTLPQQIHAVGGVRQQQYVLATPGQPATPVSQVIFCGGGVGGVSGVGGAAPVITSVLPAGGAVLTPHHTLHQ
ncbi:PREDICTED: uncharacterized protein LOC106106919 [Papilio polytes]|uniref:uncharacterized protein LOC106106919 n=1 Tax=Papilio polytes TaxID=76194 RepID=UPI0006766009|nr:PREDICTED: uncharacterized protein LOC106106919 [Papilio polytes]